MSHFIAAVSESWFWRYFFQHFGWVDWFLSTFVFIGILLGLKNGLSRELPRLLESLISLYATLEFYGFFASWLARETPWPESYARIFTFISLWFVTGLVLRLLFEIIGRLVHLQIAAPFEWLGGLLVGAVRYFLFFSMISYFLVLLPMDWMQSSYKVQSWSGPILIQTPFKIHQVINRFLPFRNLL